MPEERKLVTIFFADVTGSTALADTLDPEDMRALMSRYYDHSRRLITPRGGILEKFIGDAVMAIFGLYRMHEDDPVRALTAALALREAVANDEILSPIFRLRIGVNTGEVVATDNPDRLDFLVTGDAVNVAARLQQGANPGEIVVSQRTANATRQAFFFMEPRLFQAKGKPQPLQIFPLQSQRPARLVERHYFVGREQELRQLELLHGRVLHERHSQVATIIAPSGTGKSRLLAEFLTHLGAEEFGHVAFAHCLPYGEALTYWPLRSLLTELIDRTPDKEQVQAIYQQGGYESADAERLASVVMATPVKKEEDGESRGVNLFKPLPLGVQLNLSNEEGRDVFTTLGQKMKENFRTASAQKYLGLPDNQAKRARPHKENALDPAN